jgi:hypothetical protein
MLPTSNVSSRIARSNLHRQWLRLWVAACSLLALPALSLAQTVSVEPALLQRIPAADIGDGRYWQQLRIVLAHDDAASSETIAIELPEGVVVHDSDTDGALFDEIRVVYRAAEAELPRFKTATVTSDTRIVIESQERAGVGGELYVQFPILSTASQAMVSQSYRSVEFADAREQDLSSADLPTLTFVDNQSFAGAGSMGIVDLGAPVAAGIDTLTTARGTWFPSDPATLMLWLPDLVFDAGLAHPNLSPGHGDGDDANDTVYRFFFSGDALLAVNASLAAEAFRIDDIARSGEVRYTENEGEGSRVRLVTRDLPAGPYWLYVTADVTGEVPLARSRVLVVRHEPVIERLGPSGNEPLTFDSGGLFDGSGTANGLGVRRLSLDLSVVDHDDSAIVHLFYSGNPNLGPTHVSIQGETTILAGAPAITVKGGLAEETPRFDWDTTAPTVVPEGDYYLYAVAVGGTQSTIARTSRQILVRHAPFLHLDATRDGGSADTIHTGGIRAQRYLTLTWGRNGAGGDDDVDDNARIDLYYSDRGDFILPTDVDAIEAAAAAPEQDTHLIVADLREDPDGRAENQFIWDLWSLEGGRAVPEPDRAYSVYGVISDGSHRRLVRMHGGTPGDAGSWIHFVHEPVIRLLQPAADLNIDHTHTARISWQDMDLDDDARIRVVLSAEDQGAVSDYATVTAGLAFVINSADGRALPALDPAFDLSQDDSIDHVDVGITHLARSLNADGAPQPGTYTLYLAITEGESFDSNTRAWRAPGRLNVTGNDTGAEVAVMPFRLQPEAFTIGNGGGSQTIDVIVDAAGDTVDLVLLSLRVAGDRFSVRDMDTTMAGVQPFVVGPGFSDSKLVTNAATTDEAGGLFLTLEYFDPVTLGITGLDGTRRLARFDLLADDGTGSEPIQLVADVDNDRPSQLESGGNVVGVPQAAELATALLVEGRATVGGRVILEGRTNRAAVVDVALRRWGRYADVADGLFAITNDEDLSQPGVQLTLSSDGDFVLQDVPPGRFDLHLRRPGYLEGRAVGLELYPGAVVGGVRPSTSGATGDSIMLGGDVAGFVDTAGVSQPDNEVTLADWDFVASLFDRQVSAEDDSSRADMSGDGAVNIRDLSLVGANFRARGPRPVYRRGTDISVAATVRLDLPEDIATGDTVSASLYSTQAAHAVQADLDFDEHEWLLVGPRDRSGYLATERRGAGFSRVAVAAIGAAMDPEQPLISWLFVARREEPSPPMLGSLLLLDDRHRDLEVSMSPTTAVTGAPGLPVGFALLPNYPNPFNPNTMVTFTVPAAGGSLRLDVFDVLGQRIAVLAEGVLAGGTHRVAWDGRDLRGHAVASGVYFSRLFSADAVLVRPMLLLR